MNLRCNASEARGHRRKSIHLQIPIFSPTLLKLNSVTVNTETKSPYSDRRAPFRALIVSLGKKVIIYSALLLNKDHIPVPRRVFFSVPDDELIVKKR